jgi:DNA-binding GntR family transcriptional regulator
MPAPMTTHLAEAGKVAAGTVWVAKSLMYTRYITDYTFAISSPSLSDSAYEAIKRLIIRLELPPGAPVNEEELQQLTGIGRTPVREALQRLERDQLVSVIPRRGVFVTAIDVGDLALLYETRSMLEPYVHRLAAVRGSEKHWEVMDQALRSAARMKKANWTDLLHADRICHEQVWSAANNRFLTQTLEMLYSQAERLWHQYVRDLAELHSALDEHREVLEALRNRDGDRAAALIEGHVRGFENQTRAVLEQRLRSPMRAS